MEDEIGVVGKGEMHDTRRQPSKSALSPKAVATPASRDGEQD